MAVLASWVLIANVFNISRTKSQLTKEDIPVIAREAAGLVPIKDPNDAGRTAVREYYKEIIAQNKAYLAEVHKIELQDLYTPESYVDEEEANQIIAQLEAVLDVE